jgi:acylphosphatase
VEVVAEAEEATLKQFLETIRTGSMKNFIHDEGVSWSDASDTFDEFEIRYS